MHYTDAGSDARTKSGLGSAVGILFSGGCGLKGLFAEGFYEDVDAVQGCRMGVRVANRSIGGLPNRAPH